jgi:hypothetical protein
MGPSRTTWWIVVSVAACVAFSYVLPTVIERVLVARVGPFWAYVVLGDVVGCMAIGALTQWRLGIVLYLILDAVEGVLFLTHLVGPTAMMWLADAVPTFLLCLLAVVVVRMRGGWRFHPDA